MDCKVCTACGENKEFSEYYKAKRGKYGLSAICKVCDKKKYEKNKSVQLALQKERYRENPEHYLQKAKAYREKNIEVVAKKDSIRHREKRLANHEQALMDDAKKRLENAEAIAIYKQRYVDKNIAELKARRKEKYTENREANIKASVDWCRNNPERSRANKKRWADQNPDKVAESRARRRSVKGLCVPCWSTDEWERFLVKEIYHLARLRTSLTGFQWHVDHKVPLMSKLVCGLHCSANLEAVPASINLSKSNLFWEDMP